MNTTAADNILDCLKKHAQSLTLAAQGYAVDFAKSENPSHREMFLLRTEQAKVYQGVHDEIIPMLHAVEVEARDKTHTNHKESKEKV
jgi:hypothetical protein